MKVKTRDVVLLIGRLLLAAIFLLSGFGKIMDFAGTAEQIAGKGLPLPQLLTVGAIVFELVGGLMVATGFRIGYGAVLLILFLVPTTLLFHNFWSYSGQEMEKEIISFLKNLSILGGLLITLITAPGALSLGSDQADF